MDAEERQELIKMAVNKIEPKKLTLDDIKNIIDNLILDINNMIKQNDNKLNVKIYENGSIAIKAKTIDIKFDCYKENEVKVYWSGKLQREYSLNFNTKFKIICHQNNFYNKEFEKLSDAIEWLILNIIIKEQ